MEEVQLRKSKAELEKLNLEVESLRKNNKWEPILKWIRLIASIVAVLGLFFGLYKFYVEQQRERITREVDQKLRFQNQMRTDIDEILRFPEDKDQTIARISFLLGDLATTLDSYVNKDQRVSDVFPTYKETFTENLVILVASDSDFLRSHREVSLAAIALERWEEYGPYLKQHLDKLNLILYAHTRGLRHLRDTNPGYIEDMKYYDKTNQYFVLEKYEKQEGEERRFQHFKALRNGFKAHLKLTDDNQAPDVKKVRQQNLRDFEAALCNRRIAKQILEKDFADEPCEQ